MGMSHCSQTAHSLVLELFRDAARREPTAPWSGNNSPKEERDGGEKVTTRSERRRGGGRPRGTRPGDRSHLIVDGNVAEGQRKARRGRGRQRRSRKMNVVLV